MLLLLLLLDGSSDVGSSDAAPATAAAADPVALSDIAVTATEANDNGCRHF